MILNEDLEGGDVTKFHPLHTTEYLILRISSTHCGSIIKFIDNRPLPKYCVLKIQGI